MNPRMRPLAVFLELNSRLLRTCLDGIDDALAAKRPAGEGNNIAFLVCHLVHARYFLAGIAGATVENPLEATLAHVKGADDLTDPPKIASLLEMWRDVTDVLANRFDKLTDTDLDRASPQSFPIDDKSLLGGIAFLLQHESFHLGQLALLRREFGLPAMSYR
jgi:hypothetical protein